MYLARLHSNWRFVSHLVAGYALRRLESANISVVYEWPCSGQRLLLDISIGALFADDSDVFIYGMLRAPGYVPQNFLKGADGGLSSEGSAEQDSSKRNHQ